MSKPSILTRLVNLIKARINGRLDKWEDPIELMDQELMGFREQVSEFESALLDMRTNTRMREGEYAKAIQNSKESKHAAELARNKMIAAEKAGDEKEVANLRNLATRAFKKMKQEQDHAEQINLSIENEKANAEKMQAEQDAMQKQIQDLSHERNALASDLRASRSHADMMEKAKAIQSPNSAFENIRQKALESSARVEVMQDMKHESVEYQMEQLLEEARTNTDAELEAFLGGEDDSRMIEAEKD